MATKREGYLEGHSIPFHEDRPIGVVREEADEYEYEDVPTMNIGPLAIILEYQLVIISVYF
ncbi:hypothetical protein ACIQ4Z_07760 [Peribacillus asahii]|uniref:hypothetical protein n=1 Tax=Peribacillus asahii TaxID=228899 RepID=UPI003822D1CE